MNRQTNGIHSHTGGISPIIGVLLMLLLTLLLAGITVSVIYDKNYMSSLKPAPMAVIEIQSVVGGMPHIGYPHGTPYRENFVVLVHNGGDSLDINNVYIVITGKGCSTTGSFPHFNIRRGQLTVRYEDLGYGGKLPQYAARNKDLSDGLWSAGEKLVMNGDDSIKGTAESSVIVTINGICNTSNNYGLKENSVIIVELFDRDTNRIIARSERSVDPAR